MFNFGNFLNAECNQSTAKNATVLPVSQK